MNKIFTSYDAAVEFLDATEEATGIISNSPTPGQWTVCMSAAPKHPRDMTQQEMLADMAKAMASAESHKAADHEKDLQAAAKLQLIEQVIVERAFEGRTAVQFRNGARGMSAKVAKPAAEGLEKTFREGRLLLQDKEMARRHRVLVEQLRNQCIYSPHHGGYISP